MVSIKYHHLVRNKVSVFHISSNLSTLQIFRWITFSTRPAGSQVSTIGRPVSTSPKPFSRFQKITFWWYLTTQDPVSVEPGQFMYSIGGFTVAGAMLEAATNKTFEQLMTEVGKSLVHSCTIFLCCLDGGTSDPLYMRFFFYTGLWRLYLTKMSAVFCKKQLFRVWTREKK